ncbi:hypothetical protein HZB78_00380 [Candidatus Collierbacteria bacterium]|nr:hypothetical protein [Candidatus Collierbacteria bacterium]
MEFTTNLLVTQPFLAVAVSLSEGFANVIIPPSRRESETQRKLSQLSEASFHVRYRQLDIGNRICPEINLRVEILYDELQRVKQDFQQKLQNGTVQVVEDTIGKPRPIFVSTLDTEEASVELFTEFSRLAELEDIFGSNRFKSAVEKLYQRPQANLDYAKKQAYANRASVQAVVLAEKEGEIKASKYFVNKRVLESFDLT